MKAHPQAPAPIALLGLLASLTAALAGVPAADASVTLDPGAWYTFDDPDQPGLGVGITPWPAYAFRAEPGEGRAGSALRLRGEPANGLMLPNPAAFFGPLAERGTITLWVRPDFAAEADGGQRCILDFMRETQNTCMDGYEILIYTDGDQLCAQAALGRRMSIPTPLGEGRWTHVALTWDAAVGSKLYVNGEEAAETKGAFEPTPLTWWPGRVGAHTAFGGYPFNGWIDELRLFTRPLDTAEVRAMAQATAGPHPLEAITWRQGTLGVRNGGTEPLTVWIRYWLPQVDTRTRSSALPPDDLWGHLPLPEHEFGLDAVQVGGATGLVIPATPRPLASGEAAELRLPLYETYLGPVRYGLMVSTGLEAHECAGRQFDGLVAVARPDLLRAGTAPRVTLVLQNLTGAPYVGTVSGSVEPCLGGAPLPVPPRRVSLKPGGSTAFDVSLGTETLEPGCRRIRLQAAAGADDPIPLRSVLVPVLEDTDYRTVFGVGATYLGRTPFEDLFGSMARDGVKVLRREHRQSFREEQELWPYGFRLWYTAAFSANALCADPALWQRTERLATDLGRALRDKPWVLNQVMLGEGLNRTPCYCDHCNAAFRAYLLGTYGDIARLNAAWGSSHGSFDEVEQLGSPQDVSTTAERMALMERALPEGHAQRWAELFAQDRPRATDWRRWHDSVLVQWYRRFADAFHRANGGRTAVSEQPCWPNFRHHILFSLGKIADLGGMDLYLPGELPTTLGYAAELCMNFDLNASIFQGKPLWLNELYVQDNSPAGLAEAQGWWLVGRGYAMLTYFTYDYYKEGVRAGLPLIFGLFDDRALPYPVYDSFVRFGRDAERFHRRYDALSLRRERPRVAVFLGDDVSLANWLETGGQTWEAAAVQGHVGAYWLVERNGYPVEFINDDRFDLPREVQVLVVPWTHVINETSLTRIVDFARRGGTVLLDGPVGLYDEHYRPYSPLPGGRALRDLGVTFAEYRDEPNRLIIADDSLVPGLARTELQTTGVPVDVRVSGAEVLARDAAGNPGLVRREVGRGQVYWFLTALGRTNRSRRPDPAAVALWGGLIQAAGLRSRHSLHVSAEATGPASADLDHGGAGLPMTDALCDVSVRLKGDDEAFVFVVSFFNETRGDLAVRLPPGSYEVTDAVTRRAIAFTPTGDGIALPLSLPAYGAGVICLRAADPGAFRDW